MGLLEKYLELVSGWGRHFPQERTLNLAIGQSIASLCCPGRKTITQAIAFAGREHLDWGSDYKLHSRSPWLPEDLFQEAVENSLRFLHGGEYVAVAFDDTRIRKSGKKIPYAQYHRDPLSPPFHTNFMYGLRMLQASVLLPLYMEGGEHPPSPRGIPVCFSNVPVVRKPPKKASEEEMTDYRRLKRRHNLSAYALDRLKDIRSRFDMAGAAGKRIIYTGDGSFCNKTIFGAELEGGDILARCRRDASICHPAPSGSGRVYSKDTFTPEDVRKDEDTPWANAEIFFGGRFRDIRYKEINGVLWRRGAKRRRLRLIVIAPTPYKTTKSGKTYYREPAYLLTTNLDAPAEMLIQSYFDRWEIEVNHRDVKTVLGAGQAQVRNESSVTRQPSFVVASYSLLLLAALLSLGPRRGADCQPLPKWRRNARRPSCQDLVALLRKEVFEHEQMMMKFRIRTEPKRAFIRSAA